jgi:hypothetical protein
MSAPTFVRSCVLTFACAALAGCTEYVSKPPDTADPIADLGDEAAAIDIEVVDVGFDPEPAGPEEVLDTADPFLLEEPGEPEEEDLPEPVPDLPVKEEVADGVCVPDCFGKDCGPDGCGSYCGYCPYGYVCDIHQACVVICTTAKEYCAARACGPDNCDPPGTCPPGCESGYSCNEKDGSCVLGPCVPDCGTRECGDDGCDLTNKEACGKCAAGYTCTEAGLCGKSACYGIDVDKGTCVGKKLVKCVNKGEPNEIAITIDCSQKTGSDGKPQVCGYDPWLPGNNCIDQPPCVPTCNPKTEDLYPCGNGGCVDKPDACGICPYGWGCPGNYCRPVPGATCGYIPEAGYCWTDNTLYWCNGNPYSGGTVSMQDCNATGKTCAWNDTTKQYECR